MENIICACSIAFFNSSRILRSIVQNCAPPDVSAAHFSGKRPVQYKARILIREFHSSAVSNDLRGSLHDCR